ncbi:MAG: NlpC/P60 family protein [Verrucomicrobiota bacterium]
MKNKKVDYKNKQANRFVLIFFCSLYLCIDLSYAQLSSEEHKKLVETSRWLATKRISYAKKWSPPNEKDYWVMDCSNTARYLYKKTFNVSLPRTASSQYYTLKKEGKVHAAPLLNDGSVDTEKLLSQLRSGDLLFWEWTYDIKRTPPVSHVMIYLGQTANGKAKMTGSASRARGEHGRQGGIDVYSFNPNSPSGGVKNIFGKYVRRGRFIAYGRPMG